MNNPSVVTLTTKDTWYLVAENVKYGVIDIQVHQPYFYYHTYVLTGESAPTDLTNAVRANSSQIDINATDYIDVYMRCSIDNGKLVVAI